ncbi:hypothetical protein BGZ95_002523 [Linnemannia exigua]|uniref:UBA domain-containing protein n=1 Tax=Linnemannia exigua TaxID=604196 RepID=A0AAD4D5E6_9FUNG|nr:hypothetical protein BGZ95_002523 [Linnemannia exigua]
MPEDVIQRRYHDFSLEHRIVQEYQRIMAEEAAVIEAKESAYKLYAGERQARLKQERITMARKIAPGFLDNDDRRILTPTLATAQVKEQTNSSAQQANTSKYAGNRFDYSEFEAKDPIDEGPGNRGKDEGFSENRQPSPLGESLREEVTAPIQDRTERDSNDGSEEEEEVIVQAVPLSELTGLLRDSCLEEDSSSSAPRTWHERDPASEKSTIPSFSATRLDFREFEQGLGPPDPWDTPVDDLTALKDVISQQMGHSSSTMQQDPAISASRSQQPQHVQSQQAQHSLSQPAHHYPQHQHQHQQLPAPTQQYHQATENSVHGQYAYPAANTPSRTAYNSSPVPVASFVAPTKLTGIAQQQAALQHHQQQHRHSTGGIGAHSTTGLTPSQQHARFGNASPSPPPLPPPPRAMTTSPSVHSSAGAMTPGVPTTSANRPRLPARPLRPNDPSSTDSPTSASLDHVTVVDRSMTPPRPPLPPPPHTSTQGTTSSSIVSGGVGGISVGGNSGSGGGMPPALKPRPPKDHEMLHGMLASNQKTVPTGAHGGFTESDGRIGQGLDDSQQQQQVAPAPPQAESLISHLESMGFTREQSRSALEKYDYDLEKASNHLLDWDE